MNLRESMLTLFGKTEAEETTEELVDQACNPEMGAIRADYRDVLCSKLNEVLGQPSENQAAAVVQVETCEAKPAEREFCTKKPGRNFKNACQEAGCCWDPKPSVRLLIINITFTLFSRPDLCGNTTALKNLWPSKTSKQVSLNRTLNIAPLPTAMSQLSAGKLTLP